MERKQFLEEWRNLDEDFADQASADGGLYIRPSLPTCPVEFVIILPEPSLADVVFGNPLEEGWSDKLSGPADGVLLYSAEEMLLHHAIRHFLAHAPLWTYHLTYLAKSAMPPGSSEDARTERYEAWFPHLEEELELTAMANANIVAVGSCAYRFLQGRHWNILRLPLHELLPPGQGDTRGNCNGGQADPNGLEMFCREYAKVLTPASLACTMRAVFEKNQFRDYPVSVLIDMLWDESDLTDRQLNLLYSYSKQCRDIIEHWGVGHEPES